MAVGPGKYDDILTEARRKAGAHGAILLVLDGSQGGGFACQITPEQSLQLPALLRGIADPVERDVKEDFKELMRTSTLEPKRELNFMPDPILKTAVAEIDAILKKHDIAGVVVLTSKSHVEYLMAITPTWSCCTYEDTPQGKLLRVKAKAVDYPSKEARNEAISDTIGMLMGLSDVMEKAVTWMGETTASIRKQIRFTHWTRQEKKGPDS